MEEERKREDRNRKRCLEKRRRREEKREEKKGGRKNLSYSIQHSFSIKNFTRTSKFFFFGEGEGRKVVEVGGERGEEMRWNLGGEREKEEGENRLERIR